MITIGQQSAVDGEHAQLSTALKTNEVLPPEVEHELKIRIAAKATPKDVARWICLHLRDEVRVNAVTWVEQANKSAHPTYIRDFHAALAVAPTTEFSGAMLVSNNPEGLTSAGEILRTSVAPGKLGVYVHHSNHTHTAKNLYLRFRPAAGTTYFASGHGESSSGYVKKVTTSTGIDEGLFNSDPNVEVANAAQAGKLTAVASVGGADVKLLPLGQLMAKSKTAGAGNEPLFDAKFELNIATKAGKDGGDAPPLEVDVLAAEANTSTAQVTQIQHPAKGNTKYQSDTSNGRAAGVYLGQNYDTDETVAVSKLGSRYLNHLTGGANSGKPAPALVTEATHDEIGAAAAKALIDKADGNDDYAVALMLDAVLRISTEFLVAKGAWDPSKQKFAMKRKSMYGELSADYGEVIDALLATVKEKSGAQSAQKLNQLVQRSSANAVYASYGTMIHAAYFLHNDTDAAASLHVAFLNDSLRSAKPPPFRANIDVDLLGKHSNIAINSDTEKSKNSTDLGRGPVTLAAGQGGYVHLKYMSPGQISANQAIEITGKGGKPVTAAEKPEGGAPTT